MNILVLCTGNSARSILLEALLNKLGAGRVCAFSAGARPSGKVHPQSLKLLKSRGYDISSFRSKSWDEFASANAPEMDIVITVCSSAAGETCPIWPGKPLRSHWGVEDPAETSPEHWNEAFETAYSRLRGRAEDFLSLPLETLDRRSLQLELDKIGKSG